MELHGLEEGGGTGRTYAGEDFEGLQCVSRPVKRGYCRLEPYEGKLSRTVPRGGLPREGEPLCAGHAPSLGGESPLRARQRESLAEAKGVRREAESEGSWRQTSGLTNRNRI